ncbi:hypothetical protein DS837_10765 [Azospirillum brasilense]|uniref:Uncharacterized protein n=2 Tax=Azospirillum brasilense TaxID=192 RepID=A0A6L3B1M4_AZOBR|nr:hypothetical protein DS837_10765 [Azospirillum brasilense]
MVTLAGMDPDRVTRQPIRGKGFPKPAFQVPVPLRCPRQGFLRSAPATGQEHQRSASKWNPTVITTRGAGRIDSTSVAACEADGGLHFAVALSRLTQWPIQAVEAADQRGRPLHFCCEDDTSDWVFDAAGIFLIDGYQAHFGAVLPKRYPGLAPRGEAGMWVTFYSEEELRGDETPLPAAFDEGKVESCMNVIHAHRGMAG